MVDKVIESISSLNELANAIADKADVVAPLTIPQMTSAVNSLYSNETIQQLLQRTITSFEVPRGTISIGSSAFANCIFLQGINIPKGVTSISPDAFSGCTALETIFCDFDEGTVSGAPWGAPNTTKVVYGAIFEGTDGLEYTEIDGGYAVTGYSGSDADVVIPSVYNGRSVREIATRAFSNNLTIQNVTVANGITNIRERAFERCSNLIGFTSPANNVVYGIYIFLNCNNLKNVTLKENSIRTIPYGMFQGCTSLQHLDLPEGLNGVHPQAFLNCSSLVELVFPSTMSTFTYGSSYSGLVCSNCTSLKRVVFERKVNGIASNFFNGCTQEFEIFVPWAEGEIAGAPWGAENAVIHYNSEV